MATTTQNDNRAKFLELRKQGVSVADARNQTYGPPPVVTDATPITPTPITNQEVQQGVNAVGGTAEQRRQTRANITAGQTITPPPVPSPVATTPEPVPTVTPVVETPPSVQGDTAPVTPKVDATPGITQDAFQQAKIESEKIKAQNDAVMAQNQQKSELARQDEAMRAEALIPKDEKSVLNALISGVSVPKQNTQAYRNAEVKANNYRKYTSMTPTQLLDNMKMGEISSEMDQLLASNPNYAQAKQKLNEFQKTQNLNKTMSNIVGGMKGKEVTVTTPEQEEEDISSKIMKKYGLDDANASAFAQFVATDAEMADNKAKLLANRTQLSNVNRQISETTTLLNQGIKDLKAQYPDMSASGIITLMGSRLGEFNDAITNLNSTKTLLTADIKDEMDLAKSAFDARSEDIKTQNVIRSSLALSEAKAAQEKAQQEAALNDPATAIKSVMDEYKKLGIPFTSTVQSRLAEFKASGLSLPDYLTKMGQNIQASPAYQQYQKLQQGQLSDREKFQMQTAVENQRDIRNFAQQKELAKFNNDLGRQKFLFEIENDPEKKAKALALQTQLQSNKSLFDVLGKNVGTYEGNRGYDLAGAIGDPLPAGGNWTVKSIDTAGEQVGSIFIGGKGKKPYGNTVVMEDENGNEIRYSHLQNIGVKPGDVLGFGDIVGTRGNTGNVRGANGETLTAEQLKAGRGAHLDVEIKSGGKLLSNADQVKFLKSLKGQGPLESSDIEVFNSLTATDKKKMQNDPSYNDFQTKKSVVMQDENANIYDVMKFSQGGKDMGEERLKSLGKFSQALSQISDLSKAIDETETGPIIGRLRSYNPYDPQAQALVAQINSVVPNIARGVYGEVGVLTDADIQNYAKTLPNIKSTEDTNKLVLAMTLKTMLNGFKGQIQIDGSAGRDVSGFAGTVKQYETKINNILNSIGGNVQSSTAQSYTPQQESEFDSLYNGL